MIYGICENTYTEILALPFPGNPTAIETWMLVGAIALCICQFPDYPTAITAWILARVIILFICQFLGYPTAIAAWILARAIALCICQFFNNPAGLIMLEGIVCDRDIFFLCQSEDMG